LLSFFAKGQTNIPNGVNAPASATAKPLPFTPSPATEYFRTIMPVMAITDTAKVRFGAPVDSMAITTQYADGLGRALETIVKQASPLKKDYVVPATYDDFGRQSISYLPYVSTGNNGLFNATPFKADSTFYKNAFPDEKINYSQATYDGSPLNRVLKTTAPGNSWTGAGVGVSYNMRANNTADSVRLWTINIVNEDDVPATASRYTAGTLVVQQTTDERGIKTVVYKDELGRTVLSKQQVSSAPSTGHYGWLCTYFIYDEMNHLRIVIPPKAVDALNTSSVNWNLSGNPTIKTGLCFSYFYDSRGRAIMKYIPGKGKNYFAYDLFDRVVMTQDANLRQTSQWAFVKYDGQSRPFRSGVITSALVKDSIIAQAARSLDYPTLAGTYTITSETYFDDYTWISGGAPNSSLVTTYINSTNFITSYNISPDYAQQITVSNRIRGSVTGSKKIILNTATYLYTVPLYDDHGRVIQVKQTNYTGGTDVLTSQYGFTGHTLRTHLYQQKSGTNAQTHTLLTKYSYDAGGRLKSLIKNIDGLGDKTISQETYNESGQALQKIYGASLETQNYTYNIRGWLTSINKGFITTAGSTANYFGEALSYDYGFTNSQLNGSIAGATWKARGDGIARAYGFTYDNANRLTKADFSQQNEGFSTWTNSNVDFTTSGITYDGGGNIISMNQKGLTIGSSTTIDSLKYQYFANSNQLQKVSDAAVFNSPGLGDFRDTTYSGDDYTYDVNGNITKDYNRKMHTPANGNGAKYNLLDKPDSIVISGKATFYYYYDAGGNTLKKQVKDYTTGVTKNYLYLSGFVYLNDTLQYVQTEEGRIRWSVIGSRSSFVYDYYLRDHLGNVRTVLTEEKDTAAYMPASLETANLAIERLYYSGVDTGRVNKSSVTGYPTDAYTSPNDFVQQLSGSGYKIGTGIVLKVMAGDQFNIRVSSWYRTNGTTPGTPVNLLSNLLSALAGNIGGIAGAHGGATASQLNNSGVLIPGATDFLNNRTYTSTKPKAYLNWVLVDDQFKMVTSGSGAEQVGNDQEFKIHVKSNMPVTKNGYLYVYVSNETPNINVIFDNLQVTQMTGPLSQEQSYYPFGLQMAGISDAALGKLNSQNKFNGGSEFEEDYGVNLYSTFYRRYDPQIGRFSGVDSKSESTIGMSVYQFGGNNPVSMNDPLGDIQTAGLYGGSNSYYNFNPGHHSHDGGGDWHFANPNDGPDWMDSGDDGGGGGGDGGGGGGVYSFGSDGFSLTGDYAVNFFASLKNAINNADDGNWSFTAGINKNGHFGYWESYGFTSSVPTIAEDGTVQLAGVGIGQRFVSFENNDGGHLSSKSFAFTKMTSSMYEAGVSGLFFEATVASGWSSYSRIFMFSNIYVGFPSSTMDKRHFSTSQASNITAEAFNNAALSLALHFQFFSPEDIAGLSNSSVQSLFSSYAQANINESIMAGAYVSKNQYGHSTITTPAIWGP